MATQTYANHRYLPKLTVIGFMLALVAIVCFVLQWLDIGGAAVRTASQAALTLTIVVLLVISRAYTVKLQDRIIRIEMKLRCAQFMTPAQMSALSRISMAQLVALRFASNEEMPALLERTERETLTADQIKRAVKTWVPDWDRT